MKQVHENSLGQSLTIFYGIKVHIIGFVGHSIYVTSTLYGHMTAARTIFKCYGLASKYETVTTKTALVCPLFAYTLLFILYKVSHFTSRWYATADEELFSWKPLPDRTNKTLQNALPRDFSPFSKLPHEVSFSFPTSPVMKLKNWLSICPTGTKE